MRAGGHLKSVPQMVAWLPAHLWYNVVMKWPPTKRAQILRWHFANGGNVSATAARYRVGRQTLYRWLKRYDPTDPRRSLKPYRRGPKHPRQPSWLPFVVKVSDYIAEQQAKTQKRTTGRQVHVYLAAHGIFLSLSTVGTMLAYIRRQCPVCRDRGVSHYWRAHHPDWALARDDPNRPRAAYTKQKRRPTPAGEDRHQFPRAERT